MHRYEKQLKKCHRLKVHPSQPSPSYSTMCDLKGKYFKRGEAEFLQCENGTQLHVTDTDTKVTCISCARIIIGVPRRRPPLRKVPRKFTSRHIRNAQDPLGLLRKK